MKPFSAMLALLALASTLLAQNAPVPGSHEGAPHLPQSADVRRSSQGTPSPHRPRVALALSGGGSLGIAHIGVLAYLDEHHIPVDGIAGSSMGAIIGALYATGHSAQQMEQVFADPVWQETPQQMPPVQPRYTELPFAERQQQAAVPGGLALRLGHGLSLPAGLTTAEPLDLLFSRLFLDYSAVEDFSQLPTPLRCVATQLETGEVMVLSRGSLPRALRASMAVPGIFTPVEWEGHLLVDGGLVDNLPTDVARAMGADVVVAVHFSTPLPPVKQLQSLGNVITQAVSIGVSVTERENLRTADLVLAPSLVGIGGIDYTHAHELIERGYQAAAQKERFLATLALNDADWAAYLAERRSKMRAPQPLPAQLIARSADAKLAQAAQAELNREDAARSQAGLERALARISEARALPAAFYRLQPQPPAAPVTIVELDPPTHSQLTLRPALEAAIANGEPARATVRGFAGWVGKSSADRLRAQVAFGYSPLAAAEYEHRIAASRWFVAPALGYQRQDTESYAGGAHLTHWQDTASASLALAYQPLLNLRLRAQLEAGYEQLCSINFPGTLAVRDGGYLQPRLIAEWNSLNQPALPTRGALFAASIAERYRHWDGRTVPLARLRFEQNEPLFTGTLTATLSAAGSFGRTLSYFDLFTLGGPADLHAYLYDQFHATSYALGSLAWRKPVGSIKFFGERPQIGAWYDTAGIVQPLQSWQSAQSGSVGVLLGSPLGPLTFAIGRTSDGQTRGWIKVGGR